MPKSKISMPRWGEQIIKQKFVNESQGDRIAWTIEAPNKELAEAEFRRRRDELAASSAQLFLKQVNSGYFPYGEAAALDKSAVKRTGGHRGKPALVYRLFVRGVRLPEHPCYVACAKLPAAFRIGVFAGDQQQLATPVLNFEILTVLALLQQTVITALPQPPLLAWRIARDGLGDYLAYTSLPQKKAALPVAGQALGLTPSNEDFLKIWSEALYGLKYQSPKGDKQKWQQPFYTIVNDVAVLCIPSLRNILINDLRDKLDRLNSEAWLRRTSAPYLGGDLYVISQRPTKPVITSLALLSKFTQTGHDWQKRESDTGMRSKPNSPLAPIGYPAQPNTAAGKEVGKGSSECMANSSASSLSDTTRRSSPVDDKALPTPLPLQPESQLDSLVQQPIPGQETEQIILDLLGIPYVTTQRLANEPSLLPEPIQSDLGKSSRQEIALGLIVKKCTAHHYEEQQVLNYMEDPFFVSLAHMRTVLLPYGVETLVRMNPDTAKARFLSFRQADKQDHLSSAFVIPLLKGLESGCNQHLRADRAGDTSLAVAYLGKSELLVSLDKVLSYPLAQHKTCLLTVMTNVIEAWVTYLNDWRTVQDIQEQVLEEKLAMNGRRRRGQRINN